MVFPFPLLSLFLRVVIFRLAPEQWVAYFALQPPLSVIVLRNDVFISQFNDYI